MQNKPVQLWSDVKTRVNDLTSEMQKLRSVFTMLMYFALSWSPWHLPVIQRLLSHPLHQRWINYECFQFLNMYRVGILIDTYYKLSMTWTPTAEHPTPPCNLWLVCSFGQQFIKPWPTIIWHTTWRKSLWIQEGFIDQSIRSSDSIKGVH